MEAAKFIRRGAQRVAEHRKKLIGDVSKKLRRASREARRRKLRKASRRDRGKREAAKIREPAALQALRKHLRRAEEWWRTKSKQRLRSLLPKRNWRTQRRPRKNRGRNFGKKQRNRKTTLRKRKRKWSQRSKLVTWLLRRWSEQASFAMNSRRTQEVVIIKT